jgi:hypothetical protein
MSDPRHEVLREHRLLHDQAKFSCGKRQYTDKKTAQTAANYIGRKGCGRMQEPYECPGCHQWHLRTIR